ncbi:37S ribosomal protein Rsm25 [Colletotrichum paranaense]|uniref:37S ribosomal protein S25, mitochondrial n=8 Tax=Colletotrichum acutatum species complex TaxID=2707335 RepID=A0A9Q0B6P0_9PEZI|nr:37S ribosomal protein Rsm25 [Colletotrichum lupini]XP_060317961.1 37S ribosomal protein Rsm25 [Colletotrichum costaricense]XP_060353828.1 37S ribosomal protein Rsm25 [Colletotrichum paranaense]XP_060377039.1 37S ribosomal protein Rsm25 [Colletotrichum tamarilloi]XP_060391517.1 37S ribosomal protein Rsm25 [Colletotrichum abscissum]KAK0376144.1 37S ribosomal protein Rsm25 [Colletotrichum limetticola]KAK1474976.1 37S ribosomal protein Rsm25 [Colletotrichum cuscutae]KAI3553787.1 37S ribosomal
MGRQIRPARIYQTVSQELNSKILPTYPVYEPPWFQVMRDIPPSEIITRPAIVNTQNSNRKNRKPQGIYKPQQIVHEEDSLRKTFFRDHPWELARPRMILETDGKDYQRCDWSKGVRQYRTPLTGECVVQRQLWLMHNKNYPRAKAYDIARKEFYALRQEEEIEKRVAREEARHVGAYFGKNRLQIAQDLEDKEFEVWKGWASNRAVMIEQARTASYANFGEEATDEVAVGAEAEAAA